MNIFDMSEDFQELFREVLKEETPYLTTLGLNFKLLGTAKASNIISVKKEGPITEFLTNENQIIVITLYERAFEKLDKKYQKLIAIIFDGANSR